MGRLVQAVWWQKQGQMGNVSSGDMVKPQFVALANFLSVNTPVAADFALSTGNHRTELERDAHKLF